MSAFKGGEYHSDRLFSASQSLLMQKKTSFKDYNLDQVRALGWQLPAERALILPGSKSPLLHHIVLIFTQEEWIALYAFSRMLGRRRDTCDYISYAFDSNEEENFGCWVNVANGNQENIILKFVLFTSGFGNEPALQAALWSSCAALDASFKARAVNLLQPSTGGIVLEPEGKPLENLIQFHLNRVGFKKIKETLQPNGFRSFLVVLSNESDSVDDCWKRFPMRFEITDANLITVRVFVSVKDKAHAFERGMKKEAIEMIALVNSHIPEGFYVFDSTHNQVQLLFQIACKNVTDEATKILLQNYYEAAIAVYKWSAWAFVQLALKSSNKHLSPAEVAEIKRQVIERSPNERKCIVLSYDKREKDLFEHDRDVLLRIQQSPVLSRYLMYEPFLIPQGGTCVKVYTDTTLLPLEQAFRDGPHAGQFVTTQVYSLLQDFERERISPALSMIKYKSSPMRLYLIPEKNFPASPAACYRDFQKLVQKSAQDSQREVAFSPETTQLYFNPDYFELKSPEELPHLRVSKPVVFMGGMYYILWRLDNVSLTRHFLKRLESYVSESRNSWGGRSIEGLIVIDDLRFEDSKAQEKEAVCYFIEMCSDVECSLSEANIWVIKEIAVQLGKLHANRQFHGFLSPDTVRKGHSRIFVLMASLSWRYVSVLYPAVQAGSLAFIAPEVHQTYKLGEPPQDGIEALMKSDVYSLAQLAAFWIPAAEEHSAIRAALHQDWRLRPSLGAFVSWLEGDSEKSVFSTLPAGYCNFSEAEDMSVDSQVTQNLKHCGRIEAEKCYDDEQLEINIDSRDFLTRTSGAAKNHKLCPWGQFFLECKGHAPYYSHSNALNCVGK